MKQCRECIHYHAKHKAVMYPTTYDVKLGKSVPTGEVLEGYKCGMDNKTNKHGAWINGSVWKSTDDIQIVDDDIETWANQCPSFEESYPLLLAAKRYK